MTYNNGDVYNGVWLNNMRSVKGTYKFDIGTLIYRNKDKYVGQWKFDKMHGKGIL